MNQKRMTSVSIIFLIPVILTIILGVIGFSLSSKGQCQMPNTLLWVMVSLFILGPGVVSAILALRIQNLRNTYELRKIALK
jgi:hypothetical protein